ncbi:TetR family transcriptional regulator [Gemmatimonadetes bacterium T265]|nr:TetR family transcriptional regulator [Gemmatimonadetes bacterium T265]
MSRPSLREQLLESGVTTLHKRGFAACGVREITSAAGVPQGSFTNHFRSKEAFGVAVLDRYFEKLQAVADATLRDHTRAPLDRLHAYFDAITDYLAGVGWRHGCLVSNMSLEAPEHSEALRGRLAQVFGALTQPFAEAVRAAQAAGQVRADLDADEAAEVLVAAWHGALLRMKVERSPVPLDRFRRVLFPALLAAPDGGRA